MGKLTLVIKPRRYDKTSATSQHFYVEEDGVEVADLFVIPALVHWNDQLKRDIEDSIRYALDEVFDAKAIQDLQEQARLKMQAFRS